MKIRNASIFILTLLIMVGVFGAGSAVAITPLTPAQITALKDPSHASGLDLQAVSTRQQQMRAQGIGDDITTTVELYRGNKGKINQIQAEKTRAELVLKNVERALGPLKAAFEKLKGKKAEAKFLKKEARYSQLQQTKSSLETQIQTMDAQLQGLNAVMEGQAEKIKATLGLTKAQIANIPAR